MTRHGALRLHLTPAVLAVFLALGTGASMAPPDPGATLVAAYSFNEGAGSTLTDVSGGGNDGALLNGASWTSDGKHGSALAFDGVDDLVSIADAASLDLTTGMTIEAWVKPVQRSGWAVILAKEADASEGRASKKKDDADPVYALRATDSRDRASLALRVGTRTYSLTGAPKSAADDWMHLAATYDGTTARLYVNAVEVALREAPGRIVSSMRPLRIGSDAGAQDRFRGTIDDLVSGKPRGADTTPPVVGITSPAAGSTVSGFSVTINADASDDVAVSSVQFLLDGSPLGAPDTAAPYSVNWNTTNTANGVHTLAAVATDTARHTTTSSAVNVTVDNLVQQVITFDDAPHSRPLNGEYPAGVVDWGGDAWFLSAPWGQLTTNSVSFNGSAATSGSFTFLVPKRLISVVAFNGGAAATTVTLGCADNADVSVSVAPNELMTIQTGWVANCSTVTIGSSNGWDTNFDHLVYDEAQ